MATVIILICFRRAGSARCRLIAARRKDSLFKLASSAKVSQGLAEVRIGRAYFLPAFFAAQNAFNLADNFALAAGLMVFFLAVAARLTERGAALLP